jgi:hypothetical protein
MLDRVSYSFISLRPSRLVSPLRQRRPSYLFHISHRYGQTRCLDFVVQALLYKASAVIVPSNQRYENLALKPRGRVFHTLQEAISRLSRGAQTDVMCATELLGLIEVDLALSSQ